MRTPTRYYLVTAAVFAIAFGLTFLSAGADSNTDSKDPKSPGNVSTNRLIVKYKEEADQPGKASPSSEGRIRTLSNAAGMEIRYSHAMSGNAHVLELTSRVPSSNVEEIAARIAALPDVEYAEPDYILFPSLVPNDSFYTSQWHYFETYGINLPAAWNITTGSSNIRIAVIDTGIVNHVDLNGRWVGGYDFIADIPTANDGNGRDSSPLDPGDWITSAESEESFGYFEGCPAEDSSWHGTHVAGTIGAASNNGIGVAGINWISPIVPVRVLGKCGGYMSDIVDGMRWAAGLSVSGIPDNTNPAKVLNLSLGGSGSCGTTLQNAINEIRAAGSVIIVAAGNSNVNLNINNQIPANCSGVITVAATDRGGDRAYYSNYGSTVEISAPGGEGSNGVYSTLNNGITTPASDSYVYYSGTSMATPHVAGVASLMYSIDPTLTPDEIMQILQSTANPFPGGSGCTSSTCGSGILNAAGALNTVLSMQLPDLIITNVTISPEYPIKNIPFQVNITIKNQGGSTGSVDIYRDVYIGIDPMTTINPATGCPAPGDYYRSDTLNLAPGQTDTKTVTVTGGLENGSYQVWVYVDSRCLVHESGEVNTGP